MEPEAYYGNELILGVGVPVVIGAIYLFGLYRIGKIMLPKIGSLMSKDVSQLTYDKVNETQIKEISATTELQFVEFNADSRLKEASSKRNKIISDIRNKYYFGLLLDLVCLIFSFFIASKIWTIFDNGTAPIYENTSLWMKRDYFNELGIKGVELFEFVDKVNAIKHIYPFLYVSLVLLIILLIFRIIGSFYRFWSFRNRFLNFIKPVWNFISYLFVSKWRIPLYAILITTGGLFIINVFSIRHILPDTEQISIYIYALLIVSYIHFLFYFNKMVRSRGQTNIKLLILRVFGIKAVSQNIFTGLARFWQLFGFYFTVVDKSYYQVYWKKKYNSNIGLYVFFTMASVGLLMFIEMTYLYDSDPFLVVPIHLMTLFGFFIPLIYVYYSNSKKNKQDIITNEEKLNQRLMKLKNRPTKLDGSFKEVPLLCYNDTWKMTVNRLSEFSDIILMDLRGLSETNKGCEYEVNFLFDYVPLEKIIFITDSESIANIKALLVKQWEMLFETSPNLEVIDPVAKIYITDKLSGNRKETQGILDVLLYYATNIPSQIK